MSPRPAALRFLLAALPLLLAPQARAAADSAYVSSIVARAHALGLAHDPHWLRLGHWRKKPLTGWESEARGPDFFLAPGGDADPSAELDATLRAIFGAGEGRTADQERRGVMPAFCRFPARIAVLLQKLALDPAKLAAQPCPRLDGFWERLQPESVSLVFSSYYLNNPASAFGHTFLRVRRRGEAATREQRELLDTAIDYAAQVDTTNGLVYSFKGLFGMFQGTYTARPYFYKVREYNDYESRDLWDYDLALTGAEVALLVAHVFELGSATFDYYYAKQNCSYYVLSALEAAAPRLHLLEHVGFPVIPIDTVKALYQNPGLVSAVHFRPSAVAQFNARVQGMPAREREAVEELARNPEAALPPGLAEPRRIRVFDAGADLVDVTYAKELPVEPDGAGSHLKQRVLERRAALLQPSEPLVVPRPFAAPHESHASGRISLGGLYSRADGAAAALGYRLTLHGLDDPLGGYPDLSQMEFFPGSLRVLGRGGLVQLERLDFLDAVSLHAMSAFDHRVSWKVRVGSGRIRDPGCESCYGAEATGGAGAAAEAGPLALFATGDVSLQAAPALRGFSFARALRVGLGPAAGLRLRLGDRATALATAHAYWLPGAAGPWTWSAEAGLRVAVSGEVSVGLSARALPGGIAEGGLDGFFFY